MHEMSFLIEASLHGEMDMAGSLTVIPTYAAALGALFIVLSIRVIAHRRRHRVGFGAAGDAVLERRVRVHANFAEYVPLALILLSFAELRGAQALWLHAGGLMLCAGRLAHAVGVSRPQTDELGRILGMAGSLSAILLGAVLVLVTR